MSGYPTTSVSPSGAIDAGDVDQFLTIGNVAPFYQGTDIIDGEVLGGVAGWYQPNDEYIAIEFSTAIFNSNTAVVRFPVSLSYMPTPDSAHPSTAKDAAVDCEVAITSPLPSTSPFLADSATLTAEQIEAVCSATWPEPAEMLLGDWTVVSAAPNNTIAGSGNVATVAGSWAIAAGGTNSDGNYNPEVWIANYLNGTLQPWRQGTNLPGMSSSTASTSTYTPVSLPYSSLGRVLALAGSASSGLTGTGNRYCSFKTYTASMGQDGTVGAWVRQADLPFGSNTIASSTTVSTTTVRTLPLSDTSGFPQSGYVNITHGGLVYTASYTGISSNTLTGVQLIWGSPLSLTTSNGDKVVSGFMDCYSTFVSLTDDNATTTDWLLVFSGDNQSVYAGAVDETGSISSWSTITCSSPFISGQPTVLDDGASILIISDNTKTAVIGTVSYDITMTPTFSDWNPFSTPYTGAHGMSTLGVFGSNILVSYRLTGSTLATVGIDLACKNTSNNPNIQSYSTPAFASGITSKVWHFSNFDGTYAIFASTTDSVTMVTSIVQTSAYQVSWVNVPIATVVSVYGSPYYVIIKVPPTSSGHGLNIPLIGSTGGGFTIQTAPNTSTLTWSYAPPDVYIPLQVWGANTTPNGNLGPLMAFVSDRSTYLSPSPDSKVTYLYIGPQDNVLYAAGEWTNNERGFFTMTYDANNALTDITEVS